MWDEMYEEFWDKLEHFCARLCRDESRAEDLTQEAAVSAVSTDVAQIKMTDAPEEGNDADTVRRMGAQLTL